MQIDQADRLMPVDKAWRFFQLNDKIVPPSIGDSNGVYYEGGPVEDNRLRNIYAEWFDGERKDASAWNAFAAKFQIRKDKTYAAVNTDLTSGISYVEFCAVVNAKKDAQGLYSLTYEDLISSQSFIDKGIPYVLAEPGKTRKEILDLLPDVEEKMTEIRDAKDLARVSKPGPEKEANLAKVKALRDDLRAKLMVYAEAATKNTPGLDEADGDASQPLFPRGYFFPQVNKAGSINSAQDGLATAEDIASYFETLYNLWNS